MNEYTINNFDYIVTLSKVQTDNEYVLVIFE